MRYFYTDAKNQPAGPIEEAEIHQLRAAGTIQAESYILAEGTREWLAYAKVFPAGAEGFAPAPRSGFLTTVSVMMIVFGALSLLFGALGLVRILAGQTQPGQPQMPEALRSWSLVSVPMDLALCVLRIVVGICLLRGSEWARKAAIYSSVALIALPIVGLPITIPAQNQMMEAMAEAPRKIMQTFMIVGYIVLLLAIVWNGIVIFCMRKTQTRAYTAPRG